MKRLKSKIISLILRYWIFSNHYNRDQFIINWLKKIDSNKSILDAGAGTQRYKQYCNHLDYISQDFGKYEGQETYFGGITDKWDSKSCDLICDITKIPLEDQSVDAIMCTEVFEHLPNPAIALKELSRILKVNGEILVTSPFRSYYHQEPYFYYSGFSKYWYEYFANDNNLEIVLIETSGNFLKEVGLDLVTILKLGGKLQTFISLIFTIPYLIYLLIIEKIFKLKGPKSCWNYHVIMKKIQ